MPHTYVSVTPGIDMTKAMLAAGQRRLTKKWLREYLRANPQKDFRNQGPGGAYVNGQEAVEQDLTLQVLDPRSLSTVAMVNFQRSSDSPWGYQAVVS